MMKHSCNCKLCAKRGCHCRAYAAFFGVLSNTARLHIINALREGPSNVTGICDVAGVEQTAASHHLRKLQEQGLVTSERDGKYVVYTLTRKTRDLMDMINDHLKLLLEVTHA